MSILYREEMDARAPGQYHLQIEPDFATVVTDQRSIHITQELFDQISDYTRSQPTGPRPGRVYKKNLGWPQDMDDNWFVYFCVKDPQDPEYVLHVPYKPIVSPA